MEHFFSYTTYIPEEIEVLNLTMPKGTRVHKIWQYGERTQFVYPTAESFGQLLINLEEFGYELETDEEDLAMDLLSAFLDYYNQDYMFVSVNDTINVTDQDLNTWERTKEEFLEYVKSWQIREDLR